MTNDNDDDADDGNFDDTLGDILGALFRDTPSLDLDSMISLLALSTPTSTSNLLAFSPPLLPSHHPSPLLLLLLLLGSPSEIQEFSLSQTSFPPVGGCLVINFSLSLSLSLYVIAADYGNINDKVVKAIETNVHKLDIALLVACGRCCRHLVVDAHRVACVAGQLRQDTDDMIVASGGSCVLWQAST